MPIPLEIELKRLELLQTSTLIGISYLDAENKLVQEFDDDPALREAIIEYQRERVRQLELSEQSTNSVKSYPTLY